MALEVVIPSPNKLGGYAEFHCLSTKTLGGNENSEEIGGITWSKIGNILHLIAFSKIRGKRRELNYSFFINALQASLRPLYTQVNSASEVQILQHTAHFQQMNAVWNILPHDLANVGTHKIIFSIQEDSTMQKQDDLAVRVQSNENGLTHIESIEDLLRSRGFFDTDEIEKEEKSEKDSVVH